MSNDINNKKWSNALSLLCSHGFTDIVQMNIIENENTLFKIKHRYKEKIILPYVAIENNLCFLICKDKNPKVITIDNIKSQAFNIEEKSVFELEKDIENIYGISAWNFLKKWDSSNLGMSDLIMVKMDLKKIE